MKKMYPGEIIRILRKERGLSCNKLAIEAESDIATISRLERGEQGYTEATLEKIATALKCEVSEFFQPQKYFPDIYKDSPKISQVSPADEWLYNKRKKWAKEIVPKYPSFNSTTDAFFKVYLECGPDIIRSMETMINSLAGQMAGPPAEERRGRPKRGNGAK